MSNTVQDSYRTLAAPGTHEIKIKGSRFIALGYPVDSEQVALDILNTVRKKEYAATHHCFAWITGIDDRQFKYSDDGEPSGTAGRPIYQAITGRDLTDILVIVVRYYGGTKLGTGGLTRAYAQATSEMLDAAPIVEKLICDRLSFSIPFSLYDRLMRIINRGQYTVISQDFADMVTMELDIRKSRTAAFIEKLTELSGGKIDIRIES